MASLITADYFNTQMETLGIKQKFAPSAYVLSSLITEASDWVENYCDRKFELQEVTEERWGPVRADRRFLADNYPVNSVTSAYWLDENGQTGSFDVSNLRTRLGGIIEWKSPLPNGAMYSGYFYPDLFYTITYSTGYATIPSPVQRATALKVAMLMQPMYQGVQEREVYMVTNLEEMIVDLLENYRRERLG